MALTLAYTEHGAGAPLVILHGLFGSARNWQAIAKGLASGFRVFALDLRNHGNSPWAPGMSYADLAEDVGAFIERHRLGSPAVLGHSLGGKAAMVLALEQPELVRALIVVDIAPVAYPHSFLPYVQAMQRVDLDRLKRREEADAALAEQIEDAGIRRLLLQNLVYGEGRYRWRVNLDAFAANLSPLRGFPAASAARRYEGPVLFIHGGRSSYVQPEHEGHIRRLFPHARLQAIAGAGHWVHVDQPQAFSAAVCAFLDGAG